VRKIQQLNPRRFLLNPTTHPPLTGKSQVEIDMKIRFKPERAFSATPNTQCPGAGLFSIPILPSCFDHLPVINCSMSLGTLDFYCWPWASPQSGHQKVFGRVPFFP